MAPHFCVFQSPKHKPKNNRNCHNATNTFSVRNFVSIWHFIMFNLDEFDLPGSGKVFHSLPTPPFFLRGGENPVYPQKSEKTKVKIHFAIFSLKKKSGILRP